MVDAVLEPADEHLSPRSTGFDWLNESRSTMLPKAAAGAPPRGVSSAAIWKGLPGVIEFCRAVAAHVALARGKSPARRLHAWKVASACHTYGLSEEVSGYLIARKLLPTGKQRQTRSGAGLAMEAVAATFKINVKTVRGWNASYLDAMLYFRAGEFWGALQKSPALQAAWLARLDARMAAAEGDVLHRWGIVARLQGNGSARPDRALAREAAGQDPATPAPAGSAVEGAMALPRGTGGYDVEARPDRALAREAAGQDPAPACCEFGIAG